MFDFACIQVALPLAKVACLEVRLTHVAACAYDVANVVWALSGGAANRKRLKIVFTFSESPLLSRNGDKHHTSTIPGLVCLSSMTCFEKIVQ